MDSMNRIQTITLNMFNPLVSIIFKSFFLYKVVPTSLSLFYINLQWLLWSNGNVPFQVSLECSHFVDLNLMLAYNEKLDDIATEFCCKEKRFNGIHNSNFPFIYFVARKHWMIYSIFISFYYITRIFIFKNIS